MKRIWSLVIAISLLSLLLPYSARADGIIIPEPPICIECPPPPVPMSQLEIRYHHVDIRIENQIAVTHVDQVFYNPNDWQVEGTYIFPVPQDAAVSEFVLWIDGEPVQGEVLSADEARRVYEDIVRQMQDPALLEYADRGAVRARIFPIAPGEERRIELEYVQTLSADNGLVRYLYPLSTEKFSKTLLEEVSISVDVQASQPIRAVYSPSHKVATSRLSENRVEIGYEEQQVLPDTDFALYYSIGEAEALHLLSYRDASSPVDEEGFFLLLLAPRPDYEARALPKDVLLVLDRSGSMDGEKFMQAQEALRYILRNLNDSDRFNIVTFSTGVETYGRNLRPASEINEALAWVDQLSAAGSTDINRALLEAASYADPERAAYLIFLTDGLPTEGVVDSQLILDNFAAEAAENLRLFAFGVGYDVDTYLLDSLTQAHHGVSTYVMPGERLDESISAFYAKISTPVLTDLHLDFGGLSVYDIYPTPLPDLFLGSQIVVVGRYRDGGETTLTLSGRVEEEQQRFTYEDQFFTTVSKGQPGFESAIPRLWATRKIGYLLNQVRLSGPEEETIDQIVRLSIRYGIVTPYTSYLVTEPMPLGMEEQDRIAQEQFSQMLEMPTAPSFGQEAVERAAAQGDLLQAEGAAAPSKEAADVVKIVGAHTYVNQGGVWIDTLYDPDRMNTIKVPFLSEQYFALAGATPEFGAALALGDRVIITSGENVYEIVSQDSEGDPLVLPATPEPGTDNTVQSPTQDEPADPMAEPTATPAPSAVPDVPSTALPCVGGLMIAVLFALFWLSIQKK